MLGGPSRILRVLAETSHSVVQRHKVFALINPNAEHVYFLDNFFVVCDVLLSVCIAFITTIDEILFIIFVTNTMDSFDLNK